MEFASPFLQIECTPEMQQKAIYHARRRTQEIVRQFVPENAPLSNLESNYIGALGEIALLYLFDGRFDPADSYDKHKPDSGDITISKLVYDIKTEAIPLRYFRRLANGYIEQHEPYGCRVWTARHRHHLHKYSGGVIFVAAPIPDDARSDRCEDDIRLRIQRCAASLLVIGFIEQAAFENLKPSWYSPPDPRNGRQRKYNSLNYIFHHSSIKPIRELLNRSR